MYISVDAMHFKSDKITFESWMEVEEIDLKKDKHNNFYWTVKTTKGTRLLCWEKSLVDKLKSDLSEDIHEKYLIKGFVNITLGGTFLVMSENCGTKAQQLSKDMEYGVDFYNEPEVSIYDEYGV